MRTWCPKGANRSTEELQQLRNQMMSMEATLNAEKTIAESLRGTIKQLTEAMTGVVAIKPKSQGIKTAKQKDDITAPARICINLNSWRP
jgi:hypothetical protein